MNAVTFELRKIKIAPLIPNKFEIEEISDTEIKINVYPFETGFAITFAHPIKRLLMSSSIGYSPIGIKIKNAAHEFDNIPGVLEDVANLIINLKNIRFKLKDSRSERVEVFYSFKGESKIYGADLENDEVEIVTPKNYLATVNEDGELEFSLIIRKGIGYVPSEDIRVTALKKEKDFIPMDGYFTPITKADYKIENITIEDNPNMEKIVFHIATDGQTTPKDLFINSLKVMESQLSVFKEIYNQVDSNLLSDEELYGSDMLDENILSEEEEKTINNLLIKIKDFGLKPRVANALISADFVFIGEVAFLDEKNLKDIKNFGTSSIKELNTALYKAGLSRETSNIDFSEDAKMEFKKRMQEAKSVEKK